MIELRSPLAVCLEDKGWWAEIPGVTDPVLEETEPDDPPPDLNVKVIGHRIVVSEQWLLDRGYVLPDPWPPTPIERALAILQPHLDQVAIYRQEQP